METFKQFSDAFWHPRIWLPPNLTWVDLEPSDTLKYPDYRHLYYYPLPFALILLVIRYFLERYCYAPCGTALGIKSSLKPKKAPMNDILEKAYKKCSKLTYRDAASLAKQLDMSERQVERWFRVRRAQGKPSVLTKFCENSWRCTYYTIAWFFGLFCLWDKPWLWDLRYCWEDYPHHTVTWDVWWYYMGSLAFYWSLAISQFFDVKRKDFWQMFIHHIVTIALISFSWTVNLTRVGTLAAKMSKYAKYQKVCDTFFAVFTVLWIVTRVIYFPGWIIYNTAIVAPTIVRTMFPAYYIFNGMLICLLCLHVFWTHLILKIAFNALSAGQMERDIRSSSDEDLTDVSNHSNSSSKPKHQ